MHPMAAALGGYRLALSQPAYRRLWLAALVSRTGDTIHFTAVPLLVLGLTGSAGAVAAIVFVEGIGLIAGGLVAHMVVDRLPPRRLLVLLDVLRAVGAGVLAAFPTFPIALPVSVLLAVGTAMFTPVSNAVVPRLVADRALPAANGLQWTAGVVLQLIGAPLGGFLISAGLARIAFALNALSFLGSALLLMGLPRLSSLQEAPGFAWGQLGEGIRALGAVRILRPLVVMQSLAALAVGSTSALLVVLAQQAYGLSGSGYGLWLSAIAIGALIGPVLVSPLARLPPSRVISGAYIVRGVGDIGLALLPGGPGGAVLLVLYGLNTSSGMVAFQTMVQREVPAPFRGRAFAVLDVVWQTGRLLSIAGGVALVTVIGIRSLFLVGGSVLMLAGAFGLFRLRRPRAPA